MMATREFDVVVWGATGFTGKWVAKYLFQHYPQSSLRWAIAGRNADKLQSVRQFIGDEAGSVRQLMADSNDQASLKKLVARTRVIISTVGPYAYYGSGLVKACAEAGTHYVDLTGEVPWMRDMIDAHASAAETSGARIVHSCGFDSIPSDMGTYYIQNQAKKRFKCYLKSVRFALIKVKGGVSGGTVHSILNVMEEAVKNKKIRRLMSNPYSLNPDPDFVGADKGEQLVARYSSELGSWTAPFVMSAINTRVVRRSNALLDYRYGVDFSYTETMATSGGLTGFALASSIAAGVVAFGAISTLKAGRRLIGLVLPAQGEGSKVDPDKPGFYVIDFHGETDNGRKLHARVSGDADPGYGSTSKMLAEAAVCLALDEDKLQAGGGFWTPSSAMGTHLLSRLQKKAGLKFELVAN